MTSDIEQFLETFNQRPGKTYKLMRHDIKLALIYFGIFAVCIALGACISALCPSVFSKSWFGTVPYFMVTMYLLELALVVAIIYCFKANNGIFFALLAIAATFLLQFESFSLIPRIQELLIETFPNKIISRDLDLGPAGILMFFIFPVSAGIIIFFGLLSYTIKFFIAWLTENRSNTD